MARRRRSPCRDPAAAWPETREQSTARATVSISALLTRQLFLIKAAGGPASRAFPAALNVATLFPNGEGRILERVGLSDKAPPAPGGTIDGNADLNHDGKNESHIDANAHKAKVTADVLNVRERANTSSHVMGTLKKDAVVRVAGSTQHGHWSMIDFDGKVGFVSTQYLKQE